MLHAEPDIAGDTKIKIYLPLFVAQRGKYLSNWEKHHCCVVDTAIVSAKIKINYATLARVIEAASATHPLLGAKTLEELAEVVKSQLYYTQFRDEYYAMEVLISAEQFKREKYYTLKRNARISPDDILGISLVIPKHSPPIDLILHDTNDDINLHVAQYDSISATARIKQFLNNKEFWRRHLHGFRQGLSELGLLPFHSVIRDMQKIVNNHEDIHLTALQEIASRYCPGNGKLQGFFDPDAFTISFCAAVHGAYSIYDIVQWIDQFDKPALNAQTLTNIKNNLFSLSI